MASSTKRKDEPPKTPPRRDPPAPPRSSPPPAPRSSSPPKTAPKTVAYNPYGYVPGGSSKKVSTSIEAQAIVTPGPHGVQVPIAIEADIPLSTEVVLASGKVTTFGEATGQTPAGPPKPPKPPKPGAEPVPHHGILSHDQLMQLWVDQGGNPALANLAANIATCESGGDTSALDNTAYPSRPKYHVPGKGASPEYSVGLWQINTVAHPQYGPDAMEDAYNNCAAIIAISHNGANFASSNVRCYRAVTNPATGLTGGGPAVPEESTAGPPAVVASWRDLLAVFAKKVPEASASIRSNANGLWRLFT